MSSNFLSRPVDWSRHAMVFAGAQKNCGISGITIVVIRKDLLAEPPKETVPSVLNFKVRMEGMMLRRKMGEHDKAYN